MHLRVRFLVAATALGAVALSAVPRHAATHAAPLRSQWSAPVNLGAVVNSPWDDALAALSKDNLSLYFTSNRPVGAGGTGATTSGCRSARRSTRRGALRSRSARP